MEKKTEIIGIGGLPRSGKDTLAELFMENGYYGVSFGDIVRVFSRKRHSDSPDPISVANMTETANWLRDTKGPDVVLEEALLKFKEAQKSKYYKGVVLYSVRAPIEADFILAHGGQLIWVDTQDEVRYRRALKYLREGEIELTFDEFKAQEALQWKPQPDLPIEAQMNMSYIKQKATFTISNSDNDVDSFKQTAREALSAFLA